MLKNGFMQLVHVSLFCAAGNGHNILHFHCLFKGRMLLVHLNSDNQIQNLHLGGHIIQYTFANHVLRLYWRIAFKIISDCISDDLPPQMKILNTGILWFGAIKPDFVACEHQRHRPACTFLQSDEHLCYMYLLSGKYSSQKCSMRNFNVLTSLCSWAGWFDLCMVGNSKDEFYSQRVPCYNILYVW